MGATRRRTSRKAKPTRRAAAASTPSETGAEAAPRELVIITGADVGARATARGFESVAGADFTAIANVLSDPSIRIVPLFGLPEERMRNLTAEVASAEVDVPDLARFYQVEAPDDRLDELAERLLQDPSIEGAYVKPRAEPPQINDMAPTAEEPPAVTPDFTPKQGYLNAAPGGIDAKFSWTKPGGSGAGVRIIDIEGAWRFTHEDLTGNQGGMVGGTASNDLLWRNHGTAVIGEFGGDRNNFGVTGICPDANVRAISIFGANNSSSKAIIAAANLLSAGDIILIELHRPGPRFNFTSPQGQRGFIAVEWWPDDLAAIKFAVAKGIIVVEAAGNGFENLDDPIYNVRPAGFPASWVNPFKRNPDDSGAIVVGAGAPPSGNFGADRSRLDFSNWGALIDAQGWGREVVTCGYGDLQGGASEDLWYTERFSGTSSASPIVVGACACVQGWLRAAAKPVLTPAQMRSRLRSTGSPQQNGPNGPATQRIGNRPNLRQLHGALFPKSVLKDAVKEAEKIKDGKELEKIVKDKDLKEKDFKDAKEKDIKDKELKEKDKDKDKELKEKDKEKDKDKELKELKEKDKDFEKLRDKNPVEKLTDKIPDKVTDKVADKVRDVIPSAGAQAATTMAERVAALEQTVQSLTHFITAELRPDLSSSALSGESDQNAAALSADLQKQSNDAKVVKDDKDVEKTRDF